MTGKTLEKVVHVPFCFYPDPIGGTEVYVESLARELLRWGVHSVIAAPGAEDAGYQRAELAVRRFATSKHVTDLRELYGAGDAMAAASFGRILDEEKPDIVHLHAFTRAVSVRLVEESRSRGLPIMFTYHTPTVSCQRGTLMRWGLAECDGVLRVPDCAACSLHALGIPRPVSTVLGRIPRSVGRLAGRVYPGGGPSIALRMTELVTIRHTALRTLLANVDLVVAVCEWARELLVRNGINEAKILLSRHGLPDSSRGDGLADSSPLPVGGPVRLAFLGRLDPTKGVHALINALRMLPDAKLELDIYGVVQGAVGTDYYRRVQSLAQSDTRIRFLAPVPSEQVVGLLSQYHALAVPSRWLETGPLVVLEAFAAGIPVIGSRLGGIAELVNDGVDGLLVEPGAWPVALQRLVDEPDLLPRLQEGVRPPRGVAQVAQEMLAAYQSLLRDRPITRAPTARTIRVG